MRESGRESFDFIYAIFLSRKAIKDAIKCEWIRRMSPSLHTCCWQPIKGEISWRRRWGCRNRQGPGWREHRLCEVSERQCLFNRRTNVRKACPKRLFIPAILIVGGGSRLLTELDIVSIEVEDLGATENSHVFKLSLSDSGAVVADDDQLGLSVSQALHDGLEAC